MVNLMNIPLLTCFSNMYNSKTEIYWKLKIFFFLFSSFQLGFVSYQKKNAIVWQERRRFLTIRSILGEEVTFFFVCVCTNVHFSLKAIHHVQTIRAIRAQHFFFFNCETTKTKTAKSVKNSFSMVEPIFYLISKLIFIREYSPKVEFFYHQFEMWLIGYIFCTWLQSTLYTMPTNEKVLTMIEYSVSALLNMHQSLHLS